eukprot:CAMPEP_0198734846 /NCGR_PEP_ID=MMETSP1475-20131203/55525_1 /TAXON_ID= ORGANISM="Unidentified sp., Strain CCMP1999" /NCGR_SAMPLE_ID=MMETSP1475 /ASSEMBLY_ACC=CAM_ASM_001111 /LENGTH=58 /DNA_ID=CAMNT_0044498397 /DNA_START=85 /DNA_END=261 /DNA_ORIENTATION=-
MYDALSAGESVGTGPKRPMQHSAKRADRRLEPPARTCAERGGSLDDVVYVLFISIGRD